MKTSGFVRFAGAIFIFVQREMTCSAVMRTTRAYDDKFSMFSCYLQSILTLNNWEIITKTRRYTIFSLWSTSSLLKLRNISDWFVEFMYVICFAAIGNLVLHDVRATLTSPWRCQRNNDGTFDQRD